MFLDTEGIYEAIIRDIVARYGKTYTSNLRAKVLGRPGADTAALVVADLELPTTAEEFLSEYRSLCAKRMKHLTLLPGAEKLIKHLHGNNIPIAIATSGIARMTEMKIRDHSELISLFHHVVAGGSDSEVKRGKPEADIFLVCASRFAAKPRSTECLVFEDAPNGVEAAIKAGMQVVMVPDGTIDRELCKRATLVLNSLEEFKPGLFGLPPFST